MRKLFSDTAGYASYNSSFQIKRFMEHPISENSTEFQHLLQCALLMKLVCILPNVG